MKLGIFRGRCEGSYFYKSLKKDINLSGIIKSNKIYLTDGPQDGLDYNAGNSDTTETFILTLKEKFNLVGLWKTKDGKRLSVSLRPLNPDIVNKEWLTGGFYDSLRFSLMKIISDSIVMRGKYLLEYVHIDHSEVSSFHIKTGFSISALNKINSVLTEELMREAAEYFTCDYSSEQGIPFINDDIISFYRDYNEDCAGAAHPNSGRASTNIYTKTGEKVDVDDVLHFSVHNDSEDDAFAAKLKTLLTELYPKQMRPTSDTDCDYSQIEIWKYASWYLTPAGLRLLPSFSHAEAPCEAPDWAVIPFDVLKKYRNPRVNIKLP